MVISFRNVTVCAAALTRFYARGLTFTGSHTSDMPEPDKIIAQAEYRRTQRDSSIAAGSQGDRYDIAVSPSYFYDKSLGLVRRATAQEAMSRKLREEQESRTTSNFPPWENTSTMEKYENYQRDR
jgi:hypothetical protein